MLHGLTNDADSWADTVETFRAELPHARVLIPTCAVMGNRRYLPMAAGVSTRSRRSRCRSWRATSARCCAPWGLRARR